MFGKVMTAMVTPFKGDGVNFKEAQRLAQFLEKNGSDSILLCGSTGENPTMSSEEKIELIKAVKDVVSVPIMVGTGSFNTRESMAFTKAVDALNIDGFLLVTPYYNKPNQRGIYEHFKAVAGVTDKPVMLYNIPGRSVMEIEVNTITALSKIPNITHLKAACGSLEKISMTRIKTDDDFLIYSGDDGLTVPILSIGGCGVVSVASHIIGKPINDMVTAFLDGDTLKARQLHLEYFDAFKDLFCDSNPVPVKYALSQMGFDTADVRLPLVPLDDQGKQIIDTLLKKHNLV